MSLHQIDIDSFVARPFDLWANQWLLLTAGNFKEKKYNTMTVAWGSLGIMWSRPFAQVVVRPCRYTYEFINKYDTYTLSAFPAGYKKALSLLGSTSGRDSDKIAEAGLTAVAASTVAAPTFAQAELVIECRKMYQHDLTDGEFLDSTIHEYYPEKSYHRVYFGEILAVSAADSFLKESK
ncbi:flavin reductase [bacterium]|nr:flavin reductase [bacterium]